ncbi:MAG: response regulator, partial [Deltaproteobacteria bacterium]|nr:response regulator [Deltaproteobacteria bacterium]
MKKHTILVVDTQQDRTGGLPKILRDEGYSSLTASSAKEVLKKLKENHVDLIISDCAMKGISVNKLLERAEKPYSPPICIILTDEQEAEKRLSAANGNEYCWFLSKPWERENLVLTVRNALKYGELLSKNETLLETVGVLAAKDFSLEEKLQRILQLSLQQINAERGSIMLRDKQGDLVIKAASRKRLIGVKQFIEGENSVSAWVVKNGKPILVELSKEDPRFTPSEKDLYKTDNFLCVPIKNEKGVVIGVFNVTDKRDGRSITKEDEIILSGFISRIVMLIENAQLKEDLEEERRRLKIKNKELLALEQMREDLINMIIHDLKGPLGEITANLDLLSYVQLESQDRECLDTAIQGGENLLRMILNMLDVRKMEDGKLKLHYEEFDVCELIEGIIGKTKTLIKQKGMEVKTVIDENVFAWVADRSLIERVLINLLNNAIRYSHQGGKVEIRSRYNHKSKQLQMEVRDNGKGIPREFQQKIFEKFGQVDADFSDRKNSTGLGLTFCRMAVEAHQGKIWVES